MVAARYRHGRRHSLRLRVRFRPRRLARRCWVFTSRRRLRGVVERARCSRRGSRRRWLDPR